MKNKKSKLRIRKGDYVKVIAGASRDIEGKPRRVLEIYPKTMKILVEGVNIRVKHEKPSQTNQQGGKVKVERPIDYSNVMLVDENKKPTRIGIRYEGEGENRRSIRYAKTTGSDL